MVNIADLKKGDMVISRITNDNGLRAGKEYIVVEAGYSRWDASPYADIKTNYHGHTIEINCNNFKDFDKV